jgi:hypothetical protein
MSAKDRIQRLYAAIPDDRVSDLNITLEVVKAAREVIAAAPVALDGEGWVRYLNELRERIEAFEGTPDNEHAGEPCPICHRPMWGYADEDNKIPVCYHCGGGVVE